jgi:hypothetical protein
MASVYMTVWEDAAEVALGDPIQFAAAVIGGANSAAVAGTGRKRRRVRLYAEAACWVKYGASPTATGASDSMPLSADNPEYVDIEAGHVLTAIARV